MKNSEILTTTQDPNRSEANIQQSIVRYYRNTFCLTHHTPRCMIFSIPNEGRAMASAGLIATGLYPGCADLQIIHRVSKYRFGPVLPIPIFFEVKRPGAVTGPRKNGQSENQIAFEDHCKQMGIGYHVVTSLEQFMEIVGNL